MVAIEVEELAAWLAANPDVLWSVDGEEQLQGSLALPCSGEDLAAALREHGGQVSVDPAMGAPSVLDRKNIEKAALNEEGGRVFRLAWGAGSSVGDSWLLVEDTLAKAASA